VRIKLNKKFKLRTYIRRFRSISQIRTVKSKPQPYTLLWMDGEKMAFETRLVCDFNTGRRAFRFGCSSTRRRFLPQSVRVGSSEVV